MAQLTTEIRIYKKLSCRLILLCLSCCLSFFGISQSQEVRHFDHNNGMPGSELYGSYIDTHGFIWFFGDGGVSKYNGYVFKHFSVSNGLPDNTVFELVEDKKGRMWTRTFSGKLAYIFHDSIVKLSCNQYLTKVIAGNMMTSLACDSNDVIWIGLNQSSKIVQIDPPYQEENVKVVELDFAGRYVNYVNNCFVFGNGSRVKAQMALYETQTLKTRIHFRQDLPVNPETRFLKISDTKFLIAFENIVLLIENNKLIKQYKAPGMVVSLSYAKHTYWIGLFRAGVCQLDDAFTDITPLSLFKEYTISKVTEDKEGGLWIINLEKGAYYYPEERITVYNKDYGLPENELSCSYKNEHLFLVASKTGRLYNYKNHQFYEFDLKNEKPFQGAIYSFAPISSESLLVTGTSSFILNYKARQWTHQFLKASNLKKAKYLKKENLLLFNNADAIYFANPATGEVLHTIKSPQKIHSFEIKDTSHIYLGLAAGLYEYKNGNISQVSFNEYTINERVTAIIQKDQWLIAGTNGWGIKAYHGKKTYIFNEQNGLVSNIVTCMLLIHDKLIVGTAKGLQQFKLSDDIKSGNKIGLAEGLPGNKIKYLDYFNDTLYVTTSEGLARVPLSLFSQTPFVPTFDDVNVWAGNILLKDKTKTLIANANNKILITYDLAYFKNAEEQMFRYRLSDTDQNWIYTNENSIYYNALEEGNYQLTIEYYHKNKGWVRSEKYYTFEIEGYFLRSWWFILICVVLVTIITFLIVSAYYSKRLLKTKQEAELSKKIANIEMKALRSQMNPHFIFNVLNSVQNYILKQDAITAHRLLGRFAKLIRNILEQSVYDTITVGQEIETLKLYIELECMRMNSGFEYTFEADNGYKDEKIPSMLIQPFIENAIRHGLFNKIGEKKLSVSILNNEEEHLTCIIKDNGIGRQASAVIKKNSGIQRTSLGLHITNERIELVKQVYHKDIKIDIIDLTDESNIALGTEVIISIPYIKSN